MQLCNINFVILTYFHLTNFFGKEKFSKLPFKNKVADLKKLVESWFEGGLFQKHFKGYIFCFLGNSFGR